MREDENPSARHLVGMIGIIRQAFHKEIREAEAHDPDKAAKLKKKHDDWCASTARDLGLAPYDPVDSYLKMMEEYKDQ